MRRLAFPLFFLSGACGLVYEVVWTRMIMQVFGSTALAVGVVLAAFMSGMAAGSWWIRRAADRSPDPLRLYAKLELGVAAAALAAHLLLDRITPAWVALHELLGGSDAARGVVQFALAFALVMAPTVLMGATLPVLARCVVTRVDRVGAGLGALYAVNTLGAVAGTVATGFFFVRAFGVHGAALVAVVGNLGVGAVAWIASGRETLPAGAAAVEEPELDAVVEPRLRALVLGGLALSGLASFAYEVYWTRALVFLLGNSTYAVTTMLTAFLLGIALGGFAARFLVRWCADRVALFGWLQLAIAASAAAALPVLFAFAEPERLRLLVGASTPDAGRQFLLRFTVALGVMLLPATLIGATFPVAGQVAVTSLRRTARGVGLAYALNTLGNVVGALLPGLVLLSWFGIRRGILAMALINAAVGLAVLATRLSGARRLRWALPIATVGLVLVLVRLPLGFRLPSESRMPWHRTLHYREGPTATTEVLLDPDTRELFMSVDGIDIGGTGFTDFKQKLLAHLPKLIAPKVANELSIGLGSAILVGESARHAAVEHLQCVEIEPGVLEGARWFVDASHAVLDDPRLEVVIDDVASHLLTTDRRYDVISADEKTAQDYASNGYSYSLEYYELLRSRLAPEGLVAQWVPTTLPPEQYRMILRTFVSAFPYVLLWYFPPAVQAGAANTILIGSSAPLRLEHERIEELLATAPFEGLRRYGLTSAGALLGHLVADGPAIRAAVADSPTNTRARPRYEFFSPADYAVPRGRRLAQNLDFLGHLRRPAATELLGSLVTDTEVARILGEVLLAEDAYLAAYGRLLAGAPEQELVQRYEEALALAPWNDSLRARLSLHYWDLSGPHSDHGRFQRSAELMERALELFDERPIAHVEHALVLARLGELVRAVEATQLAAEREPELVAAHRTMANILLQLGRRQDAAAALQRVLAIEPGDPDARAQLARLR